MHQGRVLSHNFITVQRRSGKSFTVCSLKWILVPKKVCTLEDRSSHAAHFQKWLPRRSQSSRTRYLHLATSLLSGLPLGRCPQKSSSRRVCHPSLPSTAMQISKSPTKQRPRHLRDQQNSRWCGIVYPYYVQNRNGY